MKLFLVFIFFIITNPLFAQQANCDSIIWNATRKLTWDDYRGYPIAATRVTASTHYSFVHQWHINNNVFYGKLICIFEPCVSWAKGRGSAELLAHEQCHFDIAEFFRRSYIKRVSQLTGPPQAVQQAEAQIYAEIRRDCEEIQATYDVSTNHGLITDKQAQWLIRIQSMLDGTTQYDATEVKVNLL